MKEKKWSYTLLAVLAATVVVMLTVVMCLPALSRRLKVEVKETTTAAVTTAPLPVTPEETLVTAIYEMKPDTKKISAIYIEVFHIGSAVVNYMEIPVDTKVNLSEALYKSLQTYGPELPQYLKLSNMAESFSMEYGLTGCNRILSEVLGITVTQYVRAEEGAVKKWQELLSDEPMEKAFFEKYQKWMEETSSSRMVEERWMYYESWKNVEQVVAETAPGSREKDGYLISGKQVKARLGELLLKPET